jgi:hypothetical protein
MVGLALRMPIPMVKKMLVIGEEDNGYIDYSNVLK